MSTFKDPFRKAEATSKFKQNILMSRFSQQSGYVVLRDVGSHRGNLWPWVTEGACGASWVCERLQGAARGCERQQGVAKSGKGL
jgi:hypothetical protein